MAISYTTITIRKDTKNNLDICKKIFKRHNPSFEGVPLSYDKILRETINLYSKLQKEAVLIGWENEK